MIRRKDYKKQDYLINLHDSLVDAKNDEFHVDERRYASILKLTAGGTLVMGIWSIMKSFMEVFIEQEDEMKIEGATYIFSLFGVVFVFAVFFVIAISLRYIVWKGANKEAGDGRKRNGYIICAIVLLIISAYTVVSFFQKIISKDVNGYDITKFFFDLTSFILLCELLYCAFKLRRVRDETAEVF